MTTDETEVLKRHNLAMTKPAIRCEIVRGCAVFHYADGSVKHGTGADHIGNHWILTGRY